MKELSAQNPEKFLPLTPPVFHILLALSDAELHGYGIKQEIEQRTSGQLVMGPGTLYGAIKRLLKQGLIKDAGDRSDPPDDERRRYYKITPLGYRVTQAEAQRLALLVEQAQAKKLLSNRQPGANLESAS
ncbi:MAG: helix-turn-helix transcriptional regulator [Anaerolineales bacterium]|nr:helix-turn-helix transcriptional regulator [Anaerolineales bacterium]